MERELFMKFTEIKNTFREKTDPRKKYSQMRRVCIAGILLLGFYATTNFPAYYDAGLNTGNCLMMGSVMLSAIVLFYLERSYSSKEGARPHDWNTSGGSMHAFSFARCFCPDCGARLSLAAQKKGGGLVFYVPGKAPEENVKFSCPHCRRQYDEDKIARDYNAPSRLKSAEAAGMLEDIKYARKFKLSAEFTRHYMLVALVLLLVEISCVYFARLRPVNLLLPLFVGYFLFVALINLYTAIVSRYSVADKGVLHRTAWGYRLYEFSDKSSLVRCSGEGETSSWALLTGSDNLLISPIIADWKELLKEIQDKSKGKIVFYE